jgi:hypothetical protein
MTAECRPPEGTPPGSVFDLIQTRPGDAHPIIACWCEGDEWFLWGGRRTMTPAEVAAEGWCIDEDGDHAIGEPRHD